MTINEAGFVFTGHNGEPEADLRDIIYLVFREDQKGYQVKINKDRNGSHEQPTARTKRTLKTLAKGRLPNWATCCGKPARAKPD